VLPECYTGHCTCDFFEFFAALNAHLNSRNRGLQRGRRSR
jgi:hypothetical protein